MEFFDGVGGVEGAAGGGGGGLWGEDGGRGEGGGVGTVDDMQGVVEGGEGALDERLEEGVMGAAEDEGLDGWGFGEGLGEVDAEDFGGDGVVNPAFFYERDEEGAGFFVSGDAFLGEGVGVGVGLDGGGGGEDEDRGGGGDLRSA